MITRLTLTLVFINLAVSLYVTGWALIGLNQWTAVVLLLAGYDAFISGSVLRTLLWNQYNALSKLGYWTFIITRTVYALIAFGFAFSAPLMWPLFILYATSVVMVLMVRAQQENSGIKTQLFTLAKKLLLFILVFIFIMLIFALRNFLER